jgi:hypothetical protein
MYTYIYLYVYIHIYIYIYIYIDYGERVSIKVRKITWFKARITTEGVTVKSCMEGYGVKGFALNV